MKQGNYRVEYSDDKVSAWGGFSVMQKFLERVNLRQALEELAMPESTSNNRYETHAIVERFLLSVWMGCYKFSHGNKFQATQPSNDFFRSSVGRRTTRFSLNCKSGFSMN